MSTVTNSHNNGVMNNPYKRDMRNAIFYQPRLQESEYENKLMENQSKYLRKNNKFNRVTIEQLKTEGDIPSRNDKLFQTPSIGSVGYQHEDHGHAKKKNQKESPFVMFDKLIKEKYNLQDNQFEEMSRKERNKIMVKMMESQNNMVVFPNVGQPVDGLPHLSFVYDNLKDIVKDEKKPVDLKEKYSRNPIVDMGIPKPEEGAENQARAGATFDPKQFKGNVMLFKHLNEVALSMMKHPVEASDSIKKKKAAHNGVTENFGVKLLKEDQAHDRLQSDSDDEEIEKKANMLLKIKDMITPKPATKLPSVSNKWKKVQTQSSTDEFNSMKTELK